MKICFICRQSKSLDEFYHHPEMADGHLNKCKECTRTYINHRRLTSNRPHEDDYKRYHEGTKKEYVRQRSKSHPVPKYVKRAHNKVRRAILKGILVRPSQCSQCGIFSFIEAAHIDYDHPLDVVWLCRRCHRRWDAKEPKMVNITG